MSEQCPCKKLSCPRHGDCEACRAYHQTKRHEPACDRIKAKEERKVLREQRKRER